MKKKKITKSTKIESDHLNFISISIFKTQSSNNCATIKKCACFCMSRAATAFFHYRQLSSEDFQQLRAWYKVRDTLFGEHCVDQDIKKALELASVCAYPNAVWLSNLFGGRDIASREEARQVFLGCENDPRAQGERDGFFCLGYCYQYGTGCEKDLERAKENFLVAGEFGHVFAMVFLGGLFDKDDPQRFFWLGRAAAKGTLMPSGAK
jgi:hypothetical protein